jgi:hypothetical protein
VVRVAEGEPRIPRSRARRSRRRGRDRGTAECGIRCHRGAAGLEALVPGRTRGVVHHAAALWCCSRSTRRLANSFARRSRCTRTLSTASWTSIRSPIWCMRAAKHPIWRMGLVTASRARTLAVPLGGILRSAAASDSYALVAASPAATAAASDVVALPIKRRSWPSDSTSAPLLIPTSASERTSAKPSGTPTLSSAALY